MSRSLKGAYLVDSGQLRGSFFERTVIYLAQHDPKGALGFIINRPTGTTLGAAVREDLPDPIEGMELYLGGPVQTEILSYLHADTGLIQTNILPGIEFGHSVENLLEIVSGFSAGRELKIFGGYSGWGEGQLEKELESGAWLVHQSNTDYIFSDAPDSLWPKILSDMGPEYKLLADAPNDPSLN